MPKKVLDVQKRSQRLQDKNHVPLETLNHASNSVPAFIAVEASGPPASHAKTVRTIAFNVALLLWQKMGIIHCSMFSLRFIKLKYNICQQPLSLWSLQLSSGALRQVLFITTLTRKAYSAEPWVAGFQGGIFSTPVWAHSKTLPGQNVGLRYEAITFFKKRNPLKFKCFL